MQIRTSPARARGERGTSLVGLVVVLVLLAGLAALALSSSRGDGLLSDVETIGTTGDPSAVGPPAAAGSGPAALVDASEVAACRADVASLEAAMATARTVLGAVPLTLPELVTQGFLSALPARPASPLPRRWRLGWRRGGSW